MSRTLPIGTGIQYLGPTDPDWYQEHQNLALLLLYLEEHGLMDDKPSAVIEKPWKYTREFQQALAWRERETA